jgi:HSP20 family molecular chaperone IbpA
MWSRACARLEEAERRHRKFFDLLSLPARAPVWEPPVDVFVLEGAMHIVVALPAVSPTSATVELTPRGLLIRAESRPPLTRALARIVRMEIPYGRMERRIDLPAGRYQLLKHEFVDGCLHIYLSGESL